MANVFRPEFEEGVHQILNASEEPVVFLSVSSSGHPDVVVYPDSNKLGVGERLPRGGGLRAFFDMSDQVGYWHGEQPPLD